MLLLVISTPLYLLVLTLLVIFSSINHLAFWGMFGLPISMLVLYVALRIFVVYLNNAHKTN